MNALVYLVAYAGLLCCVGVIAYKVRNYLQKPVHIRWELYPVPHEADKAEHGGSYYEDLGWWKHKQKPSFVAGMTALMKELLFLHMTLETNTKLWYRTYPFHFGCYMMIGSFFFVLIGAICFLLGIHGGFFLTVLGNLVQVLTLVGFVCILFGALALLQRRLGDPGLRRYSSREHFLNLGAFVVFAVLGLLAWFANPSFYGQAVYFMANLLSFSFGPIDSATFTAYVIVGSVLAAYVPATHMGHFFMKYFLYHDIRWGDQPTQDNPATQKKIGEVLGYTPTWKAPHIQGDGKKSWAEIATTNPTKPKE